MLVAISAKGKDLQSELDPRFGRCENFIIFNTETGKSQSIENPGISSGGGAGVQAAQAVIDSKVEAVLTGNIGPNAHEALSAADIPVFTGLSGTIENAINNYQSGEFNPQEKPTVAPHHGMKTGDSAAKRIAVPSESNVGLDAPISGHFGRCPYFTLIDLDGETIKNVAVVENPFFNNHEPGQVPQFVNEQHANVILTGGMGQRAVTFFNEFGIEVASGVSGTVSDGLKTYLSGNMPGYTPCSHDHDGCH